ncbi:recombinase RecT [Blautia pseudococcoides]|uniref:recombinase RecT n=1 Tax=Blautia pseudococcoides TaxID=1796616 RepID=UPI00148AF65B|nr:MULTISPECIES: recombinase RecT [Lachnospiraceae]MCR2021162.1 recombinase RecT [Blautia pseudococcoides]QJU14807.1 recombinase [Blautia pseudococcoides]QJU15774.1 recombinase [Blautia pseudococcoides]
MAVGNSLANRQTKTSLTAYLTNDAVKKQINNVVGGKSGTRFISSIVSAVQTTPALQECTNPSILSAALLGEALNLSPSPQLGQYYLVPFNNKSKGCKEAQFQLGYKGYIQLAKRSGVYKKINVISIKEGELVSYNPLEEELEVNLIEDDLIREETPTIGYYAMFEEVNGYKHSMYWSKRKMLAHADKYSQAFHLHAVTSSNPKYSRVSYEDFEKGNYPKEDAWKYSSFWYKDFDAMAHKTMLRQLISKWGTMSIDLQTAVEKDMAVIREDGSPEYVENEAQEDNVVVEQEYREAEQQEEPVQAASASQEPEGQMSMEDEFFRGL